MNKGELIVKQQLEIEELKAAVLRSKITRNEVSGILWGAELLDTKSRGFPEAVMSAIADAVRALDGL